MSDDRWGGDLIPVARGRASVVAALSAATDLPYEAMDEAIAKPSTIVDAVLRAAEGVAAGAAPDEGETNLLFWGLHILAQARETRLYGPLIGMCRLTGDAVLALLAPLAETTLPKVIASVFDGDPDLLEAALADLEADEVVRWALFGAYAFLGGRGRIPPERVHAFLVRFDDERLARGGDLAWDGWSGTVALLGFRDLARRRERAVANARLLSNEDGPEVFASTLAKAEAGDQSRFADHGLGDLDDAIGELEASLPGDEEDEDEPGEPVHNPLRHVGRNDPCPCGSGKKFKKCCLEAA